jgi:hypothetical protein
MRLIVRQADTFGTVFLSGKHGTGPEGLTVPADPSPQKKSPVRAGTGLGDANGGLDRIRTGGLQRDRLAC